LNWITLSNDLISATFAGFTEISAELVEASKAHCQLIAVTKYGELIETVIMNF
jgi:hypothetical protein